MPRQVAQKLDIRSPRCTIEIVNQLDLDTIHQVILSYYLARNSGDCWQHSRGGCLDAEHQIKFDFSKMLIIGPQIKLSCSILEVKPRDCGWYAKADCSELILAAFTQNHLHTLNMYLCRSAITHLRLPYRALKLFLLSLRLTRLRLARITKVKGTKLTARS